MTWKDQVTRNAVGHLPRFTNKNDSLSKGSLQLFCIYIYSIFQCFLQMICEVLLHSSHNYHETKYFLVYKMYLSKYLQYTHIWDTSWLLLNQILCCILNCHPLLYHTSATSWNTSQNQTGWCLCIWFLSSMLLCKSAP